MIHLRLIVPVEIAPAVFRRLADTAGVAHVVRLTASEVSPPGEVILCDVAREAANDLVEWLQDQGVHRVGAITIESLDTVVSDAAQLAAEVAPGKGGDSLIWEEIEFRARSDASLTVSFLVFIAVAAVISGIGILLDAPILIVGAMVVGPEYGPLAALCVAVCRWRRPPAVQAATTLAVGLLAAAAAALVATVAFRVTGLAPDTYAITNRQLTAFIARPDGMAAVVAVLAGIVGMLALTEARSGALIGVLVSVTTIPAAANIGVATAYGEWPEVRGAALQLVVNVAGLVVAGIATLTAQSRVTTRAGKSQAA
ncbi:MAG: DUF389 domain-containing protein [Acidimicrobiia bacterium]|nr:DUF389 domain-containing protein [Acidimicrobiia bacterium]MDH4363338.1 DUF389 domain-containing protein [Acidimicrobiia bacterium]